MEVMPELLSLSKEDLEDLLNCDEKLEEFIETFPEVAAILNRCQQLCEENTAMAKANLERKEDYEQLRDSTIKKVEELSSLHESFNNLTIQHQQICEKVAPSNIQDTVMKSASQSEEEGEKIAQEFLQKNLGIEDFLEQFINKKVEYYSRHFKGDRLGAQLKELQKAGF